MVEQLADRDLRVHVERGQQGRDLLVERELPLLDQLEHDRGRRRLRDRGERERGAGGHGIGGSDVAHARGAEPPAPVVPEDRHRHARDLQLLPERVETRLERLGHRASVGTIEGEADGLGAADGLGPARPTGCGRGRWRRIGGRRARGRRAGGGRRRRRVREQGGRHRRRWAGRRHSTRRSGGAGDDASDGDHAGQGHHHERADARRRAREPGQACAGRARGTRAEPAGCVVHDGETIR